MATGVTRKRGAILVVRPGPTLTETYRAPRRLTCESRSVNAGLPFEPVRKMSLAAEAQLVCDVGNRSVGPHKQRLDCLQMLSCYALAGLTPVCRTVRRYKPERLRPILLAASSTRKVSVRAARKIEAGPGGGVGTELAAPSEDRRASATASNSSFLPKGFGTRAPAPSRTMAAASSNVAVPDSITTGVRRPRLRMCRRTSVPRPSRSVSSSITSSNSVVASNRSADWTPSAYTHLYGRSNRAINCCMGLSSSTTRTTAPSVAFV